MVTEVMEGSCFSESKKGKKKGGEYEATGGIISHATGHVNQKGLQFTSFAFYPHSKGHSAPPQNELYTVKQPH